MPCAKHPSSSTPKGAGCYQTTVVPGTPQALETIFNPEPTTYIRIDPYMFEEHSPVKKLERTTTPQPTKVKDINPFSSRIVPANADLRFLISKGIPEPASPITQILESKSYRGSVTPGNHAETARNTRCMPQVQPQKFMSKGPPCVIKTGNTPKQVNMPQIVNVIYDCKASNMSRPQAFIMSPSRGGNDHMSRYESPSFRTPTLSSIQGGFY
jgi:hypothetical protein